MPTIERLIERKGAQVVTIGPNDSALDAARLMNAQRIGSLVVADHTGPIGIFTERDVLTRIVAARRDPAATPVRDVMTAPMTTCEPGDTVDHVRKVMTERRIRHVPVVDAGKLLGLVSIGDLNALQHDLLEETVHMMELYLQS